MGVKCLGSSKALAAVSWNIHTRKYPLDEVTAGPVQGKDTETATFSDSEKTEGLVPDSVPENPVCALSADLEDGIESVLIKFANASKLSLQVPRINKNINKLMSERRCRSIGRSAILAQTEIVDCKNKRWGINDEGTLMLNLGASVTQKLDVSQGANTANVATKMACGSLRGLKESEGIFYSTLQWCHLWALVLGPFFRKAVAEFKEIQRGATMEDLLNSVQE